MKKYVLISLALLLSASFLAVVITHVKTPRTVSVKENVEALSSSEAYYLNDCYEKTYLGSYEELTYFCNSGTEEMVKYSCELGYGKKSGRLDKCVVDNR